MERVAAKESFSPDEPLPAFTYPAIDEATKQELLKSVEEANAKKQSSVERVAAKESFAPDEPLPAFTFPVLDEEKKQELIRAVEEKRAASGGAPPAPPSAAPRVLTPPPPRDRSKTASSSIDVAKMIADVRRIVEGAWRQASKLGRQWFDAACAFIDRNRSRLPVRVRDRLSNVRAGVILAVLTALAFWVLVGLLLLVRGGHAENRIAAPAPSVAAPAPPPERDPVPSEIEEAKKQGIAELEKLTERYPNDRRVWLELAAMDSAKSIHAAAVAAVGKALAADPKANEEAVASDALGAAARKRETTDAAFTLLTGPMGAPGATVLYDLSIDPDVRVQTRTRAEEWIRSDDFKKVATPDVLIAAGLRYAKSCSDRHDLLSSAAEHGEKRVLDYLNIAKAKGGCGRRGRDDCFPCLRKDDALKDAVAALEKRLAER